MFMWNRLLKIFPNWQKSYRPISILPNLSKIYERYLNKELAEYFETLLSKYQCGFRKSHNVINALLPKIEKWRKFLGEGSAFGVLLSDLSKAFYCLSHELLIAKVHAYEIDIPSLKLLHSYLNKSKAKSGIGWKVQFLVGHYLGGSARLHTWASAVYHISMRHIPIFPWSRYYQLCRR